MKKYTCSICKKELEENETYEYRGTYACEDHLDEATAKRDYQRSEIIAEEQAKLKPLKGLDFGGNPIGKANKKILKRHIEIAKKESKKLKGYERPDED